MNQLTIEQLKTLAVDDWVWITSDIGDSYCQVVGMNKTALDMDVFVAKLGDSKIALHIADYGTKWFAYKNKEQANDEQSKRMITFRLNGCDISFAAVAPADMTVEQLVKQGNRIEPDWCACGICAEDEDYPPEIIFDYDDVKVANDDVNCTIKDKE